MTLVDLYSLLNISENLFGNFLKILSPLIVLFLILLIIKWIQMVNKASKPDVIIMRRP
tara:strand:+ start:7408 stop:7581 length:174 start_codon:yes stop_codon:yes gene_type:complete